MGPTLVTREQVLEALRAVKDPELGRDIVSLNFIEDITIEGENVSFTLRLTTPACPLRARIEKGALEAVKAIPGVKEVRMKVSSNVVSTRDYSNTDILKGVKNIIAVASGKGGVGKSTIAVNLAVSLSLSGAKVGILDADIYGPNIPLMMGVKDSPKVNEGKIIPPIAHGVKVMSLGFFYKDETPLIWRGPLVSGAIKQLLTQVEWGELDYLIVDLPPGCLVKGTRIITASNIPKNIEDITAGELIYSFDGNKFVKERVTRNVSQGMQSVYRLELEDREIIASPNHPFIKVNGDKLEWVRLRDLKIGEEIIALNCLVDGQPFKLEIHGRGSSSVISVYTNTELLRLFGLFFASFDNPIETASIIKDELGSLLRIRIDDNSIRRIFSSIGMLRNDELDIPDWLYSLPLEQRLSFIQSVYSYLSGRLILQYAVADGGYPQTNDGVNYISKNKRIVDRFHELCLITGVRTSKVSKYNDSCTYGFSLSLMHDTSPIRKVRIEKIEQIGEMDTYDISVEGSQNFLANALIVHNTGDASLTLAQTVPLSGALIVTTPQEAASNIASKALAMFRRLNIPIIGVVENMSYFICPHCGEKTYIFSAGGGRKIASLMNVDFLGEIPLEKSIREQSDLGMPVVISQQDSKEADVFKDLAFRVAGLISIIAYSRMQE